MPVVAIDAPTKPICLHDGRIGAAELPVDFVERVREEDHAADNAAARCSLDDELHATEMKEKLAAHCWCITLFEERELRTVVAARIVGDRGIICELPIARLGLDLSEVEFIITLIETLIRRARH